MTTIPTDVPHHSGYFPSHPYVQQDLPTAIVVNIVTLLYGHLFYNKYVDVLFH